MKSISILIVANYVSAWTGGLLVAAYVPSLADITIETIQVWFLVFVLLAFLVTLLIELPFVWFTFRPREHSWRRALSATPVIHGISYTLLFGWYWMASGTSMMTQLDVVPADEMQLAEPYALYFISREGKQLFRMNLNDSGAAHSVVEVTALHRDDRLFVNPRSQSSFDLLVRLDSEESGAVMESMVLENFSDHAPVERRLAERYAVHAEMSSFNHGSVPSLATGSTWEFRTGFWPVGGISGRNEKNRTRVRFAMEMPFAAWAVRHATHLAGDFLVFQLGDDQICILHPESKRIALIARGRGPIVAQSSVPAKAKDFTSTRVILDGGLVEAANE